MADVQVTVPIGLNESPAQPQEQPRPESGFVNGQYKPPSKRVSLHSVRMRPSQAEAKAPTPTPQPSQTEVLSQQIATLQTAVNALAASQVVAHSQGLNNMPRGYDAPDREPGPLDQLRLHNQYGSGPYDGQQYSIAADQPDPANFDFWDEQSTGEYHHLNNGYIQREVQRQLEAAAASQQRATQLDDLNRQAEALRARFGRDANFEEVLPTAGKLIIDSGFKMSAQEAYLRASDEIEARSGSRRSTYLPKDVTTLGAIMRYNRDTGRSGR